jgi:lipopolysaccharide heptosyltransferase I
MIEGRLLRVLITRLSAVGDCIHTLPLASAIRARYPRAMIAWCVEPGAAPLIKNHPAVNRVVVLQKGWLKSPTAVVQARTALRALQCDVAIDPQSLSKSALAAWLSGARQRIGFAPPQGRELAPHLHTDRIVAQSTHVVDRYLELLGPLNIEKPPVNFRLAPDAEAAASMQSFLTKHGLQQGFAILNPGASWDSKRWPLERYVQVARHLGQRAGLKSITTWGSPREKEFGERIVAEAAGYAVLGPQTSLLELTALTKMAALFVGSDTGPLHLAAALGVPCVAMYGTTRREVSGPYGHGHWPLQAAYHEGSVRERRYAENTAMQAITVEEVCAACDQILSRGREAVGPRRAA